MIYDYRVYTLKPGGVPEYMAAVREVGKPIRDKHGIKLAGWYYSEIGALNQVVHIWAYRDYEHLEEAKARVAADPDWGGKYIPRVRPWIESQETYIMQSPDFAPQPSYNE